MSLVGSRNIARWIVALVAVGLVLGATPLTAASKSSPAKIDPTLLAAAKAAPNGLFPVIVRGAGTDGKTRAKAAEAILGKATGTRRTLSIIGSASATVRGAQIVALANVPSVERIVRDQTFNISWTPSDAAAAASEAGILAVNAPQAWSTLGVSGQGIGVAVIDSGVADHPDLAGRIVARVDLTGEQSNGDPGGHGTHVAGLIAGDGTASGGAWTGVAPRANIVSVRVIDANGHATLSTIFAGMVVVVAAGNGGPGQGTITTPADDPFVITVGALDDNGTPGLLDDTVAGWSSQGPTAFDAIAKPDLVAPGRRMTGLRAAGSTIDTMYPERRVTALGALDAQYFTLSGTSMAAPVVAGVAALFLERNPSAGPRLVKRQLTGTAHPLLGVPTSAQGSGIVDALAALTLRADWTGYTPYPASTAFAQQVYKKLFGQPIVWRDLSFHGGVDSRGIPWTDITWDDITWDDITWEDITWEAFNWQDITWDDITWEDVTWETTAAPLGGSGGWTLVN